MSGQLAPDTDDLVTLPTLEDDPFLAMHVTHHVTLSEVTDPAGRHLRWRVTNRTQDDFLMSPYLPLQTLQAEAVVAGQDAGGGGNFFTHGAHSCGRRAPHVGVSTGSSLSVVL